MNEDFSGVPPSLLAVMAIPHICAPVAGSTAATAHSFSSAPNRQPSSESLGISAEELSHIMSAIRGPSAHTRPTSANTKASKVEKICQFNPIHLNYFLRCYMYGSGSVSVDALRELLRFCVCNEPDWVHKCQQTALASLLKEMESIEQNAGRSASTHGGEPVMLPQLRGVLPSLMMANDGNRSVPQLSCTTTHFKFVVDTLSEEVAERDKFFSAQVKVKNEGKKEITVRCAQRLSLVDGRKSANTDFQVIVDKSYVKRGETATILLSLIVGASAVFSSIHELVVLSIDNVTKVFMTFSVTNPSLPMFGTSLPCCVSQEVVGSPLGSYYAPIVLQMLKHKFILHHGLVSGDIAAIVKQAGMHAEPNAATLSEALQLKEILDEECNVLQFLAGTSDVSGTSSPSKQPKAPSSPCPIAKHISPSTAQPTGFEAGAAAPRSATGLSAGSPTQLIFPSCLSLASPKTLFALMLLWFAEYPEDIIGKAICTCDGITYVEELEPHVQGLVLWIVDLACALVNNKAENGCDTRSLAACFAAVLLHCSYANSTSKDSTEVFDENDDDNMFELPTGPGENSASPTTASLETVTTAEAIKMHLHVTTTLVSLISRFLPAFHPK